MSRLKSFKVLALTVLGAGAVMLYEGIRVTNALSLPLVLGVYLLLAKTPVLSVKKEKYVAYIVAAIIDFLLLLHGTQIIHNYNFEGMGKSISLIIMMTGAFIIIERTLEALYAVTYDNLTITECREDVKKTGFIKPLIIILACWTPFFLWLFPGNVTSDSTAQIIQAINHNYSNHHPVFQTWLIQGVLALTSNFTDSLNAVVAICIVLQCAFLAFVFAYVVKTFSEIRIKKPICIGILVYYAIMPYNIMMALNMWKDTLFSAGILLLVVSLWKILQTENKADLAFLFIGGILVCMLRNNGWYTFIAMLPIVVVFLWRKRKDAIVVLALTFAVSLGIRGPVFNALNVSAPNVVESLAIPMQQIANVITKDGNLTDTETDLISEVIEIDKVPDTYDSRVADPIKNLILAKGNTDYIVENKDAFLKLWLGLGLRNPGMYLEAYVNQTEGYYNPDVQRWQYTQGIWETQMPIYSTPLLPSPVCSILKWYVSDWMYKIPIVGMLKSIGFFVWILFILLGLSIIRKRYEMILICAPLVLYWGTLLVATPVADEFRYIYCLFIVMPILIVGTFSNTDKVTDERYE